METRRKHLGVFLSSQLPDGETEARVCFAGPGQNDAGAGRLTPWPQRLRHPTLHPFQLAVLQVS